MINALLQFIIKVVLWLCGLFATIITTPVLAALGYLFPDFSNFTSSFNTYVADYVFRGLAFAREVFLNTTGYPRALFNLIVTLYLGKLSFHMAMIPIKFVINTYRAIRGSGGEMVE